ncbi:hypothetical protein E2C01_042030 [Portunus trituberculatus]|uniref:Uncharacterized protein n=1 Tax=Portunus trituberculatus TaxID=210409 RepID=A0A5B7FP35_PORTR|nr:hypothetical protein [Portunus trituberculatus]
MKSREAVASYVGLHSNICNLSRSGIALHQGISRVAIPTQRVTTTIRKKKSEGPPIREPLPKVRKPFLHLDHAQDSNSWACGLLDPKLDLPVIQAFELAMPLNNAPQVGALYHLQPVHQTEEVAS